MRGKIMNIYQLGKGREESCKKSPGIPSGTLQQDGL